MTTSNNREYALMIHDPFRSWDTSILQAGGGNPTMHNGVLSLPNFSKAFSERVAFQNKRTYRITLGNLKNRITAQITIPNEGVIFERALNGSEENVSFLYTHSASQSPFIDLIGTGSPTLNFLTIEQQL